MALKLTPEDVAKLQDKQLANVIRKLNSGKTLTAKEEALLAQARAGSPADAEGGYVKTWEDLATAVRVDRRTLTNVRQRFATDIKRRDSVLNRADGRHAIAAWAAFLDEHGIQRRGVNATLDAESRSDLDPDGLPTMDALKRRELKVRIDRQEFELVKERELMLEVGHFEDALGSMLSQFRQALDALPGRCAGKLAELDVRNTARDRIREAIGKLRSAKNEDEAMRLAELLIVRLLPEPNYHFRVATITREVEIAKRILRECRYLEPASATLTEAAEKAAAEEAETDGPGEA